MAEMAFPVLSLLLNCLVLVTEVVVYQLEQMHRKPVGELYESFITFSQFPAEFLILTVAVRRELRCSASKP